MKNKMAQLLAWICKHSIATSWLMFFGPAWVFMHLRLMKRPCAWYDVISASQVATKMKWQHLSVNGKTMIFEKRGVLENGGCGNGYFKNRLWTPRVYICNYSIPSTPQLILPQFHSSFSPFSGVSGIVGIVGNCCFSLQWQTKRRAEQLRAFWWPKNGEKKNVSMKCRRCFFGRCVYNTMFFCVEAMLSSKQEQENSKFSPCIVIYLCLKRSEARFNKKCKVFNIYSNYM